MVETIEEIVREAGEIVRSGFHRDEKGLSYKGEVDLVTEYDLETEKFLVGRLSERFPSFTIVAEEGSAGASGDREIHIDPIDGTTNFVHGIPHVAISVGVVVSGEAVAGVVYNPILDEMFSACRGGGAYLSGERISVSGRDELKKSLIATGFPYAKTQRGPEYEWVMANMGNLLPEVRDIRRLGAASLDLCYVAKGVFDGFYELDLKSWDVAAGIVIVSEAGGVVTSPDGGEFRPGDRVVVADNGLIHRRLLEKLDSFPLSR